MPKRLKQGRQPTRLQEGGEGAVHVSTSETSDILPLTKAQVSAFMAELGRKGGKIGGKRRLETMSRRERVEVARKAAQARWAQEETERK